MDGLRGLAAEDPNVLSGLVALLSERDDLLRWRAIESLGELCAHRAATEDGLSTVLDLVRRQFWSMNDESGNIAWHAAEAIGEVLYRVPSLADELAPMLAQHLEMPIFRAGAAWAIGRVASARPGLLSEDAGALARWLDDPDALVRAHVVWALGQLGAPGGLDALEDDDAEVSVYDSARGRTVLTTVGELARRALRG